MLLVAAMGSAVFMILFSFTSSMLLSMLALVGIGSTQMFYMATNNTLIQTIVPDTLRGRVLSLFMLDFALVSVGAIMAGAIAKNYGISEAFIFGGVAALSLFVIVAFVFKQLRGEF